jgi:hypothetical protein
MSAAITRRPVLFTVLALLMAVTRFSHAGTAWLPPDASWAVFFLGGFYFAREWRWALALLLLEAVSVDCLAIRYYGVSNYCVTVAYWFIVPAYSMLWLGGAWLRAHYQRAPLDLTRLCASLVLSVTVSFLITNGAFYWLGGRTQHPDLLGWWTHFTRWYGHFLLVPCLYVGAAVLLHVLLTQRARLTTRLQTQ